MLIIFIFIILVWVIFYLLFTNNRLLDAKVDPGLFSLLPTSYPGHNILTEDIGEIVKDNNCDCGPKGKRFLVHGRAKQSEIRGCSDT